MFAVIFIFLILWMYWATFFKEKHDLKAKQRKDRTIIERNNKELQKANLLKKNRLVELEKAILEQNALFRYHFLRPWKFDDNIREYIKLHKSNGVENNEVNKIVADYYLRTAKEKAKREALLERENIKKKDEAEERRKLAAAEINEREKHEIEQRYKSMSLQELESEAMAWYEIQAEIRRGK